jgi:hypothetical protein
VDQLYFNHLEPLSVGDHHVLFLKRLPDGSMMIHFAEEARFASATGLSSLSETA